MHSFDAQNNVAERAVDQRIEHGVEQQQRRQNAECRVDVVMRVERAPQPGYIVRRPAYDVARHDVDCLK